MSFLSGIYLIPNSSSIRTTATRWSHCGPYKLFRALISCTPSFLVPVNSSHLPILPLCRYRYIYTFFTSVSIPRRTLKIPIGTTENRTYFRLDVWMYCEKMKLKFFFFFTILEKKLRIKKIGMRKSEITRTSWNKNKRVKLIAFFLEKTSQCSNVPISFWNS